MNKTKYNLRRHAWIVVLLSVVVLAGCRDHADRTRLQDIEEECAVLTRNKTDFGRSDSLAGILLEYGRRYNDKILEAKGLYYLGVYDGNSANAELRHRKLDECRLILESLGNDSLLLKAYNALGIYEVAYYRRFSLAAHYFTESMNMARRMGDEQKAIVAEQNLSAIMITTGDTLGIKYDMNIYRHAKETDDSALLISSASHCGIYYSTRKFDEEKARFYANEVKGTALDVNYHKIMAYIAMHKGNLNDARREMDMVLSATPNDPTAVLNYAELLNKMGQASLSNQYADRADSLFSRMGVFGLGPESARLRAMNHARLGDLNEAYRWEQVHSQRLDSVQTLKQKEAIASSRIRFDTQKKEHTIALQKEKMRTLHSWIIFICLIFVSSVVGMMIYLRRRNRRYRLTAERMRVAVSQEKAFRDMLNSQEAEIKGLREELAELKTGTDDRPEALKNKKETETCDAKRGLYDRIFEQILKEVVDKQCYRDPTITRDALSERVGCNHTYLSETIKHKTGMSYSRYMNSVRVNEAVRILTNGTEMSLEELSRYTGFLSLKSFYVAFKEFVGVPPGNFRDMVAEKE